MTSNRENANSDTTDRNVNSEQQDGSKIEQNLPNLQASKNDAEFNFSQPQANSPTDAVIGSATSLPNQPSYTRGSVRSRLFSILQSWQLWGVAIVLVSGSIGFTATNFLLKLPKTPDCSSVFWPVASASMRLYCAQLEANKNTTESLLAAIKLIEVLPKDHPLNDQVERSAEKWAEEILNIGEQKFQNGNIKDSIAMARKIPQNLEAYQLVAARVKKWETIWTEAENIFNKADTALRDANWNKAFLWAVQLTNVQNRYWASTKYEETVANIKLAQEETAKLDVAVNQLRRGGVDNILGAIAKAQEIREESYAYKQAQALITKGKNQIIAYIQSQMDNRNWDRVLEVVNRLPSSLQIAQVEDWAKLAGAGSSVELGTVTGMEDAIAQASTIQPNSPLYNQAQQLISRWKLEIEDVARLTRARELAQPANIPDFKAAIEEAKLVPVNNPRYQEAQQVIKEWDGQIRTIQDQPILNRSQEIALGNSVEAWQQAIVEASAITPGSPLYDDAQKLIGDWRGNIERIEDQPILDQAEMLASQKDYAGAINTAKQIKPGRALSDEVRRKMRGWRKEISAREYLDKAYQAAQLRTPEALSQAIQFALQIASSTDLYSQGRQEINGWSNQLLIFAQEEANNSLENAIKIATMIPRDTAAFNSARSLIENWRIRLAPPQPEPIPSEANPSLTPSESEIPFDTSPSKRVPQLQQIQR
jgi:hypothetical protein